MPRFGSAWLFPSQDAFIGLAQIEGSGRAFHLVGADQGIVAEDPSARGGVAAENRIDVVYRAVVRRTPEDLFSRAVLQIKCLEIEIPVITVLVQFNISPQMIGDRRHGVLVEIVLILCSEHSQLFQIAQALRSGCGQSGPVQSGKKQSREDREDRNYDQELYQSESVQASADLRRFRHRRIFHGRSFLS